MKVSRVVQSAMTALMLGSFAACPPCAEAESFAVFVRSDAARTAEVFKLAVDINKGMPARSMNELAGEGIALQGEDRAQLLAALREAIFGTGEKSFFAK